MSQLRERFCPYCTQFKPDLAFKFVMHLKSQTKRGMCPSCQDRRKLPHSKLIEMAAQDKLDKLERSKR